MPPTAGNAARKAERDAREILTDAQFRENVRLTAELLDELHDIGAGKCRDERNVSARVQAIRTILEFGHARPTQQHELSGDVTILVRSAIPTRAAFKRGDGEIVSPALPQSLVAKASERNSVPAPTPDNGNSVNSTPRPQHLAAPPTTQARAPRPPRSDGARPIDGQATMRAALAAINGE